MVQGLDWANLGEIWASCLQYLVLKLDKQSTTFLHRSRWHWRVTVWDVTHRMLWRDLQSEQILHNISIFTTNFRGALCCIELWYDFVVWHIVQAPDRGNSGEIGASYLQNLTQNQSKLSTTFLHLPPILGVHYVALNCFTISSFGI